MWTLFLMYDEINLNSFRSTLKLPEDKYMFRYGNTVVGRRTIKATASSVEDCRNAIADVVQKMREIAGLPVTGLRLQQVIMEMDGKVVKCKTVEEAELVMLNV